MRVESTRLTRKSFRLFILSKLCILMVLILYFLFFEHFFFTFRVWSKRELYYLNRFIKALNRHNFNIYIYTQMHIGKIWSVRLGATVAKTRLKNVCGIACTKALWPNQCYSVFSSVQWHGVFWLRKRSTSSIICIALVPLRCVIVNAHYTTYFTFVR